jgi:hypothetical protein
MTYKAREVLQDCHLALGMLEAEGDLQQWRIIWAAAVALIRAVGHVLDKIDGQDADVKKVAREFFNDWKVGDDHLIFREFIERERNNLLKEYCSDVHPLDAISVVVQMSVVPLCGREPDVLDLDENVYRPLLDGPWEGEDGRDVLSLAISWWGVQLDAIDAEVAVQRMDGKP